MTSTEQLEQKLKNQELDSLYLLYGEETFLLESSLKKIKKNFGELVLGINYFQIDETTVKDLIQNIETVAFGYPKKLIIVKNANICKKEAKKNKSDISLIQKYIEENIVSIKNSVVLVIIEPSVDKIPLIDVIEKNGVVCNFEELKLPVLIKKIKEVCNLYQVNMSEADLKYFVTECGTNMQELMNEIRKLIEYTEKEGTITKKAIDLLCIKQLDSIIFDLTDSLGKKDNKNALNILEELIAQKEAPQKIIISIYGHLKKLYLLKHCEEEKSDIVKSLGLKPNQIFLVSKYKEQAKRFTKLELEKCLNELTKLDRDSKIGLIDLQIGLEAFICNV